MPTPFESAQLNLQLFDLRREAVLREARSWFLLEFNPESFAELVAIASGQRNTAFRMVLGTVSGEADICKHMEAVVLGAPDAEALLSRRREALRAAVQARASEKAQTTN